MLVGCCLNDVYSQSHFNHTLYAFTKHRLEWLQTYGVFYLRFSTLIRFGNVLIVFKIQDNITHNEPHRR